MHYFPLKTPILSIKGPFLNRTCPSFITIYPERRRKERRGGKKKGITRLRSISVKCVPFSGAKSPLFAGQARREFNSGIFEAWPRVGRASKIRVVRHRVGGSDLKWQPLRAGAGGYPKSAVSHGRLASGRRRFHASRLKNFRPGCSRNLPNSHSLLTDPPFDSHSSFLNDQTNFSLTSSSNENIFRISKFYEHYKSRKIKLRLEKEYDTIKTDDLFLLFDLPSSQNERIFPPVEIGNETVRINRFGSETNWNGPRISLRILV